MKTKKPVHWVVQMNHQNRSVFFVFLMLTLGAHMASRDYGPVAWGVLALQFLVYPQLLYWRALRAQDALRAETGSMVIDALLFGCWAAALEFPLWITFMLFVSASVNLMVFRGGKGFIQAAGAMASGVLVVVAFVGLRVSPDTNGLTTLLSVACISLYLLVVAKGAYVRGIKLQDARGQIQRQHEQLAVLEERRRIVRDMHDGLGSQLVSASALLGSAHPVSPQQAILVIDHALLELRSVLDVLAVEPSEDPHDDPVAALLGALRWRIDPVLKAQGVELSWRAEGLPADFLPQDTQRLHLLRLLQEAFSNVLKHAQASHLAFSVTTTNGQITLTLADNGRGFLPHTVRGIGLDSMRRRALALGAQLAVDSTPGQGTCVRLAWTPRSSHAA